MGPVAAFGLMLGVMTQPPTVPWPGAAPAATADVQGALGGNLSGLAPDGSGGLWAVRDGPAALLRLARTGAGWEPVPGWGDGRALRYPGGRGAPDAEAVTTSADGTAVFVGAERDNSDPGASRNSILRFDPSGGGPLDATHEWRLDAILPRTDANSGVEGLAWVTDDAFRAYPGGGVFVVGVEDTADLYLVAAGVDGQTELVATVPSGLDAVMEVVWLPDRRELWALCDSACDGRAAVFRLAAGTLELVRYADPPADLASLNNEGFALSTCTAGTATAVWSDDAASGGHALREAALPCDMAQAPTSGPVATAASGGPATTTTPPTNAPTTTGSEPTTTERSAPDTTEPASAERTNAPDNREPNGGSTGRWWFLALPALVAGGAAVLATRVRRRRS